MVADIPTSQSEKLILEALSFNSTIVPPSISTPVMCIASPLHWESPPVFVFKMNFDGASKGNPRKVGYSGAIRDHCRDIIHIFYGNMGPDSNNATELEDMVAGLMIAVKINLLPLIVEGDFTIILSLATKIHNGIPVSKVTTN